ncbi:MAG: FAD-binding oxidoreductase [Pseudomonadales bacterium]|nr:FAD-binding oxidoreductase [Pseudomonadales bacterium]
MSASHPSYLSPSGWNALLPRREGVRMLAGDISCDLAIVGAGYTGIAAARRWLALRPDDSVVIVDASDLGEGNPGRNSGFLLEIALADDADPQALTRMRECNRLIGATLEEMTALVREATPSCDLHRTGTYRAAAGAAGIEALGRYEQFLEGMGLPWERLDRQQLASRIGTGFYAAGLYSPHCYLAQPAALIRGLAATLPAGVSIYERSPARELQREARHWCLRSDAGRVRARTVMLANNAFAKGLGVGASRMVAMYTYAGLTEPLSASQLATLGADTRWGLLPAHRLGSTLRRTADGRLLVRSFYGYERERPTAQVSAQLRAALARRFPELELPPFASVWGGATGFTYNGGPIWGEVEPGLFVSAGCNGGGVVKGTLFGTALAELAAGHTPPDIAGLFGRARWMPPEPLRRLGFNLISRLELRTGGMEQ